MDVMFTCPGCKQQLEADTTLSGTSINCPSCNSVLVVPEADPANIRIAPPADSLNKEDKHFLVPVSERPTESLIEKPKPTLQATAAGGEKLLRIKCVRRSDCVEVGKDRFDEIVTDILQKIGEPNIVSLNTVNYSHLELGTRALVNDYGIMIIYRG